jgi:abequosyltransferase
MPYKLSICIPTYNRAEFLKECLESVLCSAKGCEHRIDIVVSDNASTDNTADIIHALQRENPGIRYHRNKENIGALRNFHVLASMAFGKYIWIFGDDDKMEEIAIRSALEKVALDYDAIICNYSIWDTNFLDEKRKKALVGGKDKVFQNPDAVMKYLGMNLGYISSVVIKKSVFLKLPYEEYEKFDDTGFSHMYSIYAGIAIGNCRVAYVAAPVFRNRSGNPISFDFYKFFPIGTAVVFEALMDKGYSERSVLSAKRGVFISVLIPFLLYNKLHGKKVQKDIVRMMLPHYKRNWIFWLAYLPALFTPPLVVRFARNIVHTMRRVRSFVRIVK